MVEDKTENHDPSRLDVIEETTYATAHALETFIELMIQKGFLTEKELMEKMEDLSEHEDIEELGHDADAPREQDNLQQ